MRADRQTLRGLAGRLLLAGAVVCFLFAVEEVDHASAAHASSRAKQGAVVFHEKGCEHCHGVDAAGTDRGPNLSGVGRALHPPDIELQIRNGGKEMPAFGATLSDDEIKQLVSFLAAKKKKGVRPMPLPASSPAAASPSET